MSRSAPTREKIAIVLVFLMILLQTFYGLFAFFAPEDFSKIRGTELFAILDADWVQIYASRTLFIACLLGYLLYARNFIVLKWSALLGIIMPVADGMLAYNAGANMGVIIKHVATIIYLLITYSVLHKCGKTNELESD